MTARAEANVAVRAEPATIGTGRARDPLALEVRLLGSLLGQVIAEQAGASCSTSSSASAGRRSGSGARTTRRSGPGSSPSWPALEPDRAEVVIRAFSLYFRLVNLAEERELVRGPRRRRDRDADAAAPRPTPRSAAAVDWLRRPAATDGDDRRRARRAPPDHAVLTAHPTEARRRTLLIALRRVERLLARLADRDI